MLHVYPLASEMSGIDKMSEFHGQWFDEISETQLLAYKLAKIRIPLPWFLDLD
jgi:hypothetical protein